MTRSPSSSSAVVSVLERGVNTWPVELGDPWAFERPAYSVVPDWDYTLGPEVSDLCDFLRFTPDAEQEMIIDAAFGVKDELPAAAEGAVIAGRQTVKSSSLEMVCLGWMFITREPLVLWSAHEFSTTLETFLHMQKLIEANRWAVSKVKRFYASGSGVRIQMWDGRRMAFVARTTSGGRGKTGPKMILDEALELLPEHVGAMSAITSTWPSAQRFQGSSGAKTYSTVLHNTIRRGRSGTMPRGMYFEWVDDLPGGCDLAEDCSHVLGSPGCRLDDPRRLKRANPTLGRIRADGRGLTLGALTKEREEQPFPLIYARERLGEHEKPAADRDRAVAPEVWEALRDPDSQIIGEPLFVLDVAPNRAAASIVAVGVNAAGRVHGEVTSKPDARSEVRYDHRTGTAWLLPRFRALIKAFPGMRVVILKGSAAASVAKSLEKLGCRIVWVAESDFAPACGHLMDLLTAEEVAHVGDPELAAAVGLLTQKFVGDRAFVWVRSGAGDITAAVGLTLGAWVLNGSNEEPFNIWG